MHLLLLLQEAFYNLIKNWLCLCKLSNAFQVTTLIFFFSTENLISNWSFQFVFLVPGNILDRKCKNSVIKIVLIFFLTSGPFPASFYDWFSSFQYNWYLTSKQRNVQYKFCRWLDSNRGPLVSEPTALPTEPQPLPLLLILFADEWFEQLLSYGNWKKNDKMSPEWICRTKSPQLSSTAFLSLISNKTEQCCNYFLIEKGPYFIKWRWYKQVVNYVLGASNSNSLFIRVGWKYFQKIIMLPIKTRYFTDELRLDHTAADSCELFLWIRIFF